MTDSHRATEVSARATCIRQTGSGALPAGPGQTSPSNASDRKVAWLRLADAQPSHQALAEEGEEPREEMPGDRRQGDAPVRRVRVHEQLTSIARDLPTRRHEKGVVEEMVVGTHAEERGWHTAQVGVER